LFFGLSDLPLNDLFEQNRVVYRGRLPNGILAIGRTGGGNLICLSLSSGSVYFRDHEREGSGVESPGFGNMTIVAPSLLNFLKVLQPRSMEIPTDARVISVQVKPGFAEKFKKLTNNSTLLPVWSAALTWEHDGERQ
jgi:SMI1/KNR4 family protein SUKH-1